MSELEASVDALATRWHSALKDLQEISHGPSRQDHIAFMGDLYEEAKFLHSEYADQLHPLLVGKLIHITSSPLERHLLSTIKIKDSK